MATFGQPHLSETKSSYQESGTESKKAVIEYSHHYLNDLKDGNYQIPDTSLAENIEKVLEEYGIESDLLVIIDDTSKEVGKPYNPSQHQKTVEKYIEDLGVEPDTVSFESEIGETIEAILSSVPEVENSGALGQHDTWGIHKNGDKAKLYGTHSEGANKDKVTIIDETVDATKWSPYTCQAYDTGLVLEKLGLVDTATVPAGDIAITLHGDEFWYSQPHKKSLTLQSVLTEQNVTSVGNAPHFEFNTEIHDIEDVVEALEDAEVISP